MKDIQNLKRPDLAQEDLPQIISIFLESEFEEEDFDNNIPNNINIEELSERVLSLESQLAQKNVTSSKKREVRRAINEAKRQLASHTTIGRLQWVLDKPKLLERYRELWLYEKSINKLDYPIFFAVSDKGGKDNSGEPVFKKDKNGELMIDSHGHLIIDHDLESIAESFITFAKKQKLDFW